MLVLPFCRGEATSMKYIDKYEIYLYLIMIDIWQQDLLACMYILQTWERDDWFIDSTSILNQINKNKTILIFNILL